MALASELLPQPDSPRITTARLEPSSKFTPSTACTSPCSVLKCRKRSSMRRSGLFGIIFSLYISKPWIENPVECKTQHGKAKTGDHEQGGRFQDPVIIAFV